LQNQVADGTARDGEIFAAENASLDLGGPLPGENIVGESLFPGGGIERAKFPADLVHMLVLRHRENVNVPVVSKVLHPSLDHLRRSRKNGAITGDRMIVTAPA
jgi:hypothetical protein